MVDLVGFILLSKVAELFGVRLIIVREKQPSSSIVWVHIQMIETIRVECARTTDQTINLVILA